MSNFALPMDLPTFAAAVVDMKSAFAPARLAACISFGLAADDHIEEAGKNLLNLLDDPIEEIRAQAVESLFGLAERGFLPDRQKISAWWKEQGEGVQAAVLEAGDLLLNNPTEAAMDASCSPSAGMRQSAAVLLGSLDSTSADDRLQEMLDDGVLAVRQTAALQLGEKGTEKSAAILEKMIGTSHPDAAEALLILAELALPRSKNVIAQLASRRFLQTEDRAMAAAALVRFDTATLGVLESFLGSRWKSRRLCALRACAAIPHRDFAASLSRHVRMASGEEESSAALYALAETVRRFPDCASVLNDLISSLTPSQQQELAQIQKGWIQKG